MPFRLSRSGGSGFIARYGTRRLLAVFGTISRSSRSTLVAFMKSSSTPDRALSETCQSLFAGSPHLALVESGAKTSGFLDVGSLGAKYVVDAVKSYSLSKVVPLYLPNTVNVQTLKSCVRISQCSLTNHDQKWPHSLLVGVLLRMQCVHE